MIFADLVLGDTLFVDANVFVYHFAPDPRFQLACGKLLQRIENQELNALSSTAVLSEVSHRLLTIEAKGHFRWTSGKVIQRLRQNPQATQSLTGFRKAIDAILQSQVRLLIIPPVLISTAAALTQQYGLLANDALIVAAMQANGLTKLASNDPDFDRVPGTTRYAPI